MHAYTHRTTDLPVVLYGYGTLSLTLREEVAGGWRRLHNEELHRSYASPNVIRVVKEDGIGGAYSTHGRDNYIKILFGKPEGKRLLGRPNRRWEGDIRMDLRETAW
jgi:hypothetical protein